MTSNAIAYQKYLEDNRHNLEMERQGQANIEIAKQNVAIGQANAETARQQVALGYSNLSELNRSNLANEAIKEGQLAVSQQQVEVQSGQLELATNMAWPNLLGSIIGKIVPTVITTTINNGSSGKGRGTADTGNVTGWSLNGIPTGMYNEFGGI